MEDNQIQNEIPVLERTTSGGEDNVQKNSEINSNSSENDVDSESELENDQGELDSDEAKAPTDSEKKDV